ncbi:MAG: HD-GYP domain-containing protein [Clostridiales bacterium]|nr:HD-GYP domain-containing protein [Clostridiales bacterium]
MNLEQYEKQRRQTWELVIAMGNMIEKRDLYTADHQRKVAVLATAIAIQMDLSMERVESIFIAGLLHDIGKISIPSELLTKPDCLTEIEYELMKTHVQGTYDILKSISFALPIKEIAYQHHERLDGSGYPGNLKGEEIIYEAKILAVADVYEAITSHRPYRPSLGADYALKHLKDNSGILYDAKAVEVCLEVALTNEWNIPRIEKYLKYE